MTIFGKVLLVINLVYSLLGVTWAIFVYISPMDSPEKLAEYKSKADAERKNVRTALTSRDRAAEAQLIAEIRPALANRDRAADAVRAAEAGGDNGKLRHLERDWYDAELTHLRVGDPQGTPVERKRTSLQAIQFDDKDGVPKLDPANGDRPVLGPLKDREQRDKPIVQPLAGLIKIRKDAHDRIVNEKIEKLNDLIAQDTKLTIELAGDAGPPKLKGLQQQLIDERIKSEKLNKEYENLEALYVNAKVESELILRRLEEVMERYKELQKKPAGAK